MSLNIKDNLLTGPFTVAELVKVLEESHKTTVEFLQSNEAPEDRATRLEFLGEFIFDFTTYDGSISEKWAKEAIEVAVAISEGKTHEYQMLNPTQYETYLKMVNMAFFSDKLEWGTSVRGAWWCLPHKQKTIILDLGTGMYNGEQFYQIWFTMDEWKLFIQAIAEFAAPEIPKQ